MMITIQSEFGVRIHGTRNFVRRTEDALRFLSKSEFFDAQIRDHLHRIEVGSLTKRLPTLSLWRTAPKIVVPANYDTSNYHLYAILLARESHYLKLYGDLIRLGGPRFAQWKYIYFHSEIDAYCNEFRIKVAKELGVRTTEPNKPIRDFAQSVYNDFNMTEWEFGQSYQTTLPYIQNCTIRTFKWAVYHSIRSRT